MKSRLVTVVLVLVACALAVIAGCGGDDNGGGSGSSSGDGQVTLTVFAAASLTDAFTAIGKQYQQNNPDVIVKFNFAGCSNTLVQQIQQGAPGDVFASADTQNMDKLTKDSLAASARRPAVAKRQSSGGASTSCGSRSA